jgi:group I intron endonuclease
MECFIYAITNIVTGRRYIGSCVNVKRRLGEHRSSLKHNKHHCVYLQHSYNKHGRENFTFSVVRVIASNDRKERSMAELEEIASTPCFNSMQASTDLQHFESTEEVRRRISVSGKQRHKDRPELAARHSERMKDKYSDPAEKERTSQLTKGSHTLEIRKIMSDKTKLSWSDETVRAKRLNRTYSEVCTLSKSERMKAFWASPKGQLTKVKQKAAVQAYFAAKRLSSS